MKPLVPLLWTSGNICPGFQSQGRSPALLAAYDGSLRFISGVPPTDLLAAKPLLWWESFINFGANISTVHDTITADLVRVAFKDFTFRLFPFLSLVFSLLLLFSFALSFS